MIIFLIVLGVIIVGVVVFFLFDLMSGVYPGGILRCTEDSDCACGAHINTGECFIGLKELVNIDSVKQCPDFCSGIEGNLVVRCENNRCIISE